MSTITRPPGPGEQVCEPAGRELAPQALAGLAEALAGLDKALGASLVGLTEEQVEQALGLVGWARHRLSRLEMAVAADGMDRGLPGQGGFTETNWVLVTEAAHTQAPSPAHAAQVVRLAKAGTDPALAEVMGAMAVGDLSVPKADALARFHTDVKPVADPDSLAESMQVLVEAARDTRSTTEQDGHAQPRMPRSHIG